MDQIQREGDPLCVHGNCAANSLLLCCQEAAGDRTQDALGGFTAISSRYPHHCGRVAITMQGGRRHRGLRNTEQESTPICHPVDLKVECGHKKIHSGGGGSGGVGGGMRWDAVGGFQGE